MSRFLIAFIAALALPAQTPADGPEFTPDGELLMPRDYREWVYLSSGLGMTYGPAAAATPRNPAFDNVFVNRAAYRAFLESGRWPDKTMLILEIRRAAEKGSINNGGHFQTELLRVEAAVKDESRFPQKWAYFSFDTAGKAKPLPSTSTCNACHGQNAAVENTFVQFYPTLLEIASRKGTLNPAYSRAVEGQQHP